MAYKTILAHCNDKRRIARVTGIASELAARFGAHLVGLSVAPPVYLVPAGMPGNPNVIFDNAQRSAYRHDNPELKQAFLSAAQVHNVAAEWRERNADDVSLGAVVLAAARKADLIVAAQRDEAWSHSSQLDVADAVILGSGRPVLVVPNEGLASGSARRVLVAWSDTREASRAVFDALPLLQQAEDVRVVTISPDEAGLLQQPDDDICTTLQRHKVNCKATEHITAHEEVGRALIQQAIAHRADLLVMGCYGHSRLREFVLGGASRYQLRHMLIPIFMSH